MKLRYLLVSLVLLIVGACIAGAMAIKSIVIHRSCYEAVETTIASPDGKYTARVISSACALPLGAGGEWHIVRLNSGSNQTDILQTGYSNPKFRWIDPATLECEITAVDWIGRTVHNFGDVSIVYVVPPELSESAMAKLYDADRARRRDEVIARSPPGRPNKGALRAVDEADQMARDTDKAFRQWVAENARQM